MQSPPLRKNTAATVYVGHQIDGLGQVHALVVIKQAFSVKLDGKWKPSPTAEVALVDKLWDEGAPEASGLEDASDLCLRKPCADIVVKGDAMSPGKKPQRELDVLVRVGVLERALRVFGDRVYYKGVTSIVPTRPEPFESMPLRWERAYGGRDTSSGKLVEDSRNPIGRGITSDPKTLIHQPVANIEDAKQLIGSANDRPKPAGVGPIMHAWSPRKEYAGTHDETWLRERVPLCPIDFDERHNQIAPSELIYPGYLQGGEQVDLFNLCEQGALRFTLPKLSFYVGAMDQDSQLSEHRPVLDTLILRPNELGFDMVFRANIPLLGRAHELRAVLVNQRKVLT